MSTSVETQKKKATWLKKAGIAGFLFFLIKGLIWVGLGIWAWIKMS